MFSPVSLTGDRCGSLDFIGLPLDDGLDDGFDDGDSWPAGPPRRLGITMVKVSSSTEAGAPLPTDDAFARFGVRRVVVSYAPSSPGVCVKGPTIVKFSSLLGLDGILLFSGISR
jgi:hypothetical protein